MITLSVSSCSGERGEGGGDESGKSGDIKIVKSVYTLYIRICILTFLCVSIEDSCCEFSSS